MSNEAVYRTALVTPGLLIIHRMSFIFLVTILMFEEDCQLFRNSCECHVKGNVPLQTSDMGERHYQS